MGEATGSSKVTFPPLEKVGVIGPLTQPQVIGAAISIGLFMGGVFTDDLLRWSILAAVALAVTFAKWQGEPMRTVFLGRFNWFRLRDKEWSAPLRGTGEQAPCLRGIEYHLHTDPEEGVGPVAVVQAKKGGAFTVVFEVDSASTFLLSGPEQDSRFNAWGEVLEGLCVERGTVLTAERLVWTDIHQASDPTALIRRHKQHAKDGPSRDDYEEFLGTLGGLGGVGAVGAGHRVLVGATITRAGRLRLAKNQGFTGTNDEIMRQAAVAVGRDLIAELKAQGFTCGAMMSPAELARAVLEALDPFAMRADGLAARERFGLPVKTGPDQVTCGRHMVEIDGSCHRVFALRWPRVEVDAAWMHMPLGVEGPKVVSTIYGGIAPTVADRQREAMTNRSVGNNIVREQRRGRVRTKDQKKSQALLNAEKATANGRQDLDAYSFIVISGRTAEDLNRKTALMRQKLRKAGSAELREMTAHHDHAFAAALPFGLWVKATVE